MWGREGTSALTSPAERSSSERTTGNFPASGFCNPQGKGKVGKKKKKNHTEKGQLLPASSGS